MKEKEGYIKGEPFVFLNGFGYKKIKTTKKKAAAEGNPPERPPDVKTNKKQILF